MHSEFENRHSRGSPRGRGESLNLVRVLLSGNMSVIIKEPGGAPPPCQSSEQTEMQDREVGPAEPRSHLGKLGAGDVALPVGRTVNLTVRTCHPALAALDWGGCPRPQPQQRGRACVGRSREELWV